MHSEFRFTRHGCRPSYDVSVRLFAEAADTFSVAISPEIVLKQALLNAVVLGVRSAYSATPKATPLAVMVAGVTDHSGDTGELGFKICGEAAMYRLLGLPDKVPFPGYVLGEA